MALNEDRVTGSVPSSLLGNTSSRSSPALLDGMLKLSMVLVQEPGFSSRFQFPLAPCL